MVGFVVASHRPWNRDMARSLSKRTGRPFELIDSKEDLTIERLDAIDPEYVFLPHWSYKIPETVFQRFDCIIFHMTDVPFGRGGSPLQNLVALGLSDTVISALKCENELDAGAVYLKKPLNLNGSAEEVYLRSAEIIEDMIVEIIENNPVPVPQSGEPTYFKRRRPENGDVAEAESLRTLFDRIRMLDAAGYPHAFANAGPFRFEFTRAARRVDGIYADVKITLRDEDEQ